MCSTERKKKRKVTVYRLEDDDRFSFLSEYPKKVNLNIAGYKWTAGFAKICEIKGLNVY